MLNEHAAWVSDPAELKIIMLKSITQPYDILFGIEIRIAIG